MTRAEELRKAAATLRKRAVAASVEAEPPWSAFGQLVQSFNGTEIPTSPKDTGRQDDVTDFIAMMDPDVGLLLAETLETEAQLLDMLQPFTELLNATVEAQGGPKGALRLLVDEDGLPQVVSDSTPSWLRIARKINEAAS